MISESMNKILIMLQDITVVHENVVERVNRKEYSVYRDEEAVYVKIPLYVEKNG